MLASLPAEERKKVVAGLTLASLTPSTITSKAELMKDLREGEERGWFINREESVEDALAIATRFDWSGSTYIITIAGSVKRMERQLSTIVKAARAAADALQSRENG